MTGNISQEVRTGGDPSAHRSEPSPRERPPIQHSPALKGLAYTSEMRRQRTWEAQQPKPVSNPWIGLLIIGAVLGVAVGFGCHTDNQHPQIEDAGHGQ
jgi:hypothetical protein